MSTFIVTKKRSVDFPLGIDATLLLSEINDDVSITTPCTLVRKVRDSDNVRIVFNGTPSAGELTALDSVIAAHSVDIQTDDVIPDLINQSANVGPTADTDASDGFVVGQQYVDSMHKHVYVCLSASLGAAQWRRLTSTWFEASNGATTVNVTAGFTPLTWHEYPNANDAMFVHTINESDIQVMESATVLVRVDVTLGISDTGSSRTDGVIRLMFSETGSGFVELSGTRAYTYNRQSTQGVSTASITRRVVMNSNSILRVEATRNSGGQALSTVQNGCRILLQTI